MLLKNAVVLSGNKSDNRKIKLRGMKMKILKILTTIMLLSVACVSAEVPKLINYSGKLMDKTDHTVADGNYSMRFGLWDAATEGNKIWEENHYVDDGKGVPVTRGSFSTFVGSVNPAGNPMPAFDKNYYIEFAFKKDASSSWEVFPRQQIISVAYAMRAEKANRVEQNSVGYSELKDGAVGLAKMEMNAVMPVGTIMAWHKGIKPGMWLPPNWVECNGGTVNDPTSPINGAEIPNLNNVTSGGYFLRGSLFSGQKQEDAIQDHYHNQRTWDGDPGSLFVPWIDRGNNVESGVPTSMVVTADGARVANETRPKNMTVVWIMKIK